MAELPEIFKIANQMNNSLANKIIKECIILQEKCTNVSLTDLNRRIVNNEIIRIYNKGKWIIIKMNNDENIAISLGMGADILYYDSNELANDKYQIKILLNDNTGFTIRFWWFGKFLLLNANELTLEKNINAIAITPFDSNFTCNYFLNLLKDKKTQIKTFLLNQKNISGIGNMYMHDILFMARIHPLKKICDLNEIDIKNLYESILFILNKSLSMGAFAYEMDFYGKKGNYKIEDFLIGYKDDLNCPICNSKIENIKTGSTSSYICLNCQKL